MKGQLLSATISGLLAMAAASAQADHHDKAAAGDGKGAAPKADLGECHGINACKGQGACGGKGHSCAGKNTCKGQGWVQLSKADCDAKKGKFVEHKQHG